MRCQLRKFSSNVILGNRFCYRTVTTEAAEVKEIENNKQQLKSWREIPGPPSLPIIGQIYHFLPGGSLYGDPLEAVTKMYNKYGPIIRLDPILGRPGTILLFEPESIAYVLRSENTLPQRPGFESLEHYRKKVRKVEDRCQSTGLLTEQGEIWKQFRSKVNPVLLQPKTIKLYTTAIEDVAKDMVLRMKGLRDENGMIKNKFDVEMNLWALESIAVVALGCRLKCLDANMTEDAPARQLINCVHDFFIAADDLDFKPSLWRYITTPSYNRAMKIYEKHETLTKYFVRKGREEIEKKPKGTTEEKGILEKLLMIDEELAVTMANDMLVAGVDTAANTMTALLYLLAKNPEKQNKLREEIKSNKERKSYLRACIKEGMRMMPVVFGNFRQTSRDYNILGFHVPAGIQISMGHAIMSMNDVYYPRAKEYIPERWIADKEDQLYYGKTHPFVTSPFGFGTRSCIGRRIAELEVEIFLSKVVENFQIEWFGPPPKLKATTLSYIVGPFNFKFKDVYKVGI